MKYTIYSQCWYKPYLNHDFVEEITLFDPEGSSAEFTVRWYDIGDAKGPHAKLEVFDDGWATLAAHPELLSSLSSLASMVNNPTVYQVITVLNNLGYEDDTPREK
jgi:hypothetical protein